MSETKIGKNLRLTPNLIEKAEKICAENDTTLGRQVDKFLLQLIKYHKKHGELRKFELVSEIEYLRYLPTETAQLNAALTGADYRKAKPEKPETGTDG